MSQEGFARLFGMSYASYRLYETDKGQMPLAVAVKIWEVYGLDPHWFFSGTEGKQEASEASLISG